MSQRLDPYQGLALAQLLRKRPSGEMRTAARAGAVAGISLAKSFAGGVDIGALIWLKGCRATPR